MATPARFLPVPLVTQGDRSFCLYACTSMVLAYFGIRKSVGQVSNEVYLPMPGDGEVIGEFAAAAVSYLRAQGLEANLLGPGDFPALQKCIDRNNPAILAVKNNRNDALPNHTWVLRGYVPPPAKIIFNNPQRDPGTNDPVTWDGDADNIPGETLLYDAADALYWQCIPGSNRLYIPVSYPGQGPGRDWLMGWRIAARKNIGRSQYYSGKLTRDIATLHPFAAGIDGAMVGTSVPALFTGELQILGQACENWSTNLFNDGKERWDKGGAGDRILGGLEFVAGGLLAGIGYPLDLGMGIAGEGADLVLTGLEWVAGIFDGGAGDSASGGLGPTKLDVGLVLNVSPWMCRSGDNWEDVQASWSVTTRDGLPADEINISWDLSCWGWGVDAWNLSRRVDAVAGTLVNDAAVGPTRYHKTHSVKVTQSQGIRVSCWGRIPYGRDGALTRVHLNVAASARRGNVIATVEEGTGVYGFST